MFSGSLMYATWFSSWCVLEKWRWCGAVWRKTIPIRTISKVLKTQNRQEIQDIKSLIFKTFEFWCVWGYGKRRKKVSRAGSCIRTPPYIAEVVQCLCGCMRSWESQDMDHLTGTISLVQSETPSSVFFIISAKIPVSVLCFSHNKHGMW